MCSQFLFLNHRLCYLQKKATVALLLQERAKAQEEALHQEKLREEEHQIRETLEESKTKVRCVTKSPFLLLITKLVCELI